MCYNTFGDNMRVKVDDFITKKITDEVVIFQTDTVYGIGCLLGSKKGVERIYEIKKRDGNKPLAVLCANLDDVKSIVNEYERGEQLAKEHWPGALTLIFPKKEVVGDYLTSGFNTVGVRIPNDEIALKILDTYGPMAVTSLNVSTEPAILKYDDALVFEGDVDYIVEGTDLDTISSTVYDVVNKKTLRQGKITIT